MLQEWKVTGLIHQNELAISFAERLPKERKKGKYIELKAEGSSLGMNPYRKKLL